MVGPVSTIHVFARWRVVTAFVASSPSAASQDVDARHKAEHDGEKRQNLNPAFSRMGEGGAERRMGWQSLHAAAAGSQQRQRQMSSSCQYFSTPAEKDFLHPRQFTAPIEIISSPYDGIDSKKLLLFKRVIKSKYYMPSVSVRIYSLFNSCIFLASMSVCMSPIKYLFVAFFYILAEKSINFRLSISKFIFESLRRFVAERICVLM
ncbi:hypothetical protein LJR237_004991 [Bosea sp. LjRoot237]